MVGPDRILEPGRIDALDDRRALAARDHQAVEALEFGGDPDLAGVRPKPAQHPDMGFEASLDPKDADPKLRHRDLGGARRRRPAPRSRARASARRAAS